MLGPSVSKGVIRCVWIGYIGLVIPLGFYPTHPPPSQWICASAALQTCLQFPMITSHPRPSEEGLDFSALSPLIPSDSRLQPHRNSFHSLASCGPSHCHISACDFLSAWRIFYHPFSTRQIPSHPFMPNWNVTSVKLDELGCTFWSPRYSGFCYNICLDISSCAFHMYFVD